MPLWVWITCAAALAQTLRFMLQKQLAQGGISAAGATFARFVFSAPLVAVALIVFASVTSTSVPRPDAGFVGFALAGGLAQILATIVVVALFSRRNFAVGITLKKTEVLQTALVGAVVLGEFVTPLGLVGILIGFAAVLLLSGDAPAAARWRGLISPSAGLGLLSGALFGVSGVCYRGASLSLPEGEVAMRALFTLAFVTAAQTIAMTGWFLWRDRQQILRVIGNWRIAGLVGITSAIGSFCWFSAYTLQQAAYVNAVGQVELVLSLVVSWLVFGERITGREAAGIGLLGLSIVVVVLGI